GLAESGQPSHRNGRADADRHVEAIIASSQAPSFTRDCRAGAACCISRRSCVQQPRTVGMGRDFDAETPASGGVRMLTRDELKAELGPVDALLNGLPLIRKALSVLQRDSRMIRAALNDMARENVTAGEVEALHDDVDRVQNELGELAVRVEAI